MDDAEFNNLAESAHELLRSTFSQKWVDVCGSLANQPIRRQHAELRLAVEAVRKMHLAKLASIFTHFAGKMNGMAPVNALPVEIILEIFGRLDAKDRSAVSLVCGRWRDIALACAQLWSDVRIGSKFPMEHLPGRLAWSRKHPLSLSMERSGLEIQDILNVVADCRERIRKLDLTFSKVGSETPAPILRLPVPDSLRYLAVRWAYSHAPLDLDLGNDPLLLEELVLANIRNVNAMIRPPQFAQLRRLSLDVVERTPGVVSLSLLREMFIRCRDLEDLALSGLHQNTITLDDTSQVMTVPGTAKLLQSLSLSGIDMEDSFHRLLRYLSASAVKNVAVKHRFTNRNPVEFTEVLLDLHGDVSAQFIGFVDSMSSSDDHPHPEPRPVEREWIVRATDARGFRRQMHTRNSLSSFVRSSLTVRNAVSLQCNARAWFAGLAEPSHSRAVFPHLATLTLVHTIGAANSTATGARADAYHVPDCPVLRDITVYYPKKDSLSQTLAPASADFLVHSITGPGEHRLDRVAFVGLSAPAGQATTPRATVVNFRPWSPPP